MTKFEQATGGKLSLGGFRVYSGEVDLNVGEGTFTVSVDTDLDRIDKSQATATVAISALEARQIVGTSGVSVVLDDVDTGTNPNTGTATVEVTFTVINSAWILKKVAVQVTCFGTQSGDAINPFAN